MTPPWVAWATAPAAAAIFAFYLWRGRLPARLLVEAMAVGVTLGAAVAMALAPFELKTNPLHFSAATIAFLFAGAPEEGVKMLGVAAFLRPHYLARGRRDVVLAAGALSLGFAALENVFYLANAGAGWAALAVERALMAMPFHVFLGLAGGFVIASVRPGFSGVALGVAGWLALAAIHGGYDFAVFASAPGAQVAEPFRRLVAALGWDETATLRVLLAGSEAAAALAAVACLASLPPPAGQDPQGRLARLARARVWALVIGLPLAGGAALALAVSVLPCLAAESMAPLFDVAVFAVSPLALGALFLAEPSRKRAALSARARRVLAGAGVAAALALAAAAIVWGPPAQRWLSAFRFETRGVRLAARGDYPGAVDAFTRALAVEQPQRIETLSQRAAAYAADNRFEPALADLDAALRIAPGQIALYVQRADINRQRNDPAAARADLDAALKLKADDPELLAQRGQARLEAGDEKGAYADLAEASRAAPDNGLVRRTFAAWDVDVGDFDAALRDLNARLHAAPADPLALFQRGRVWLYKREPRRALDDFAHADQTPALLYPALWRFVAQARLGIDGAPGLRRRLAAAPAKWPAPVAHLLLGDIDVQAARTLAANDGERCEADYYFTSLQLDSDPPDDSAARLRAALAECPAGFIEHEGAKAELRRLAR